MLDGVDFFGLANGFPAGDLDAARLHRLGQLALQFDLEQALG
jgi:hypothetical protein